MSISIEGLDSVFAGIDALMQSFTENADQVVQEAGQECKDLAVEAVDVDTGNLRDSITYTPDTLECSVSTDVYYSVYLERGTYKMRPRAFMLPSFDIASEHMQEKMKQL